MLPSKMYFLFSFLSFFVLFRLAYFYLFQLFLRDGGRLKKTTGPFERQVGIEIYQQTTNKHKHLI